jgi:hypothetical protein
MPAKSRLLQKYVALENIANHMVKLQNTMTRKRIFKTWPALPIRARRVGTDWGGWWMPEEVFLQNNKPTIISCGLGHDISFDLEMVSHGFRVLGIEIDSDAIDQLRRNFEIPEAMQMYIGRVGRLTSQSMSLWDLMRLDEFHEEKSEYILKMDIEGAEMEVLPDLISSYVRFPIVVFELDYLSLIPFSSFVLRELRIREVLQLFASLNALGYRPFIVENWNVHLVRY